MSNTKTGFTDMDVDGNEYDFYQKLRKRIQEWLKEKGDKYEYADYLLFAPDLFHLLCKLSLDNDVPAEKKAKIAAVLAYFISPIDMIPEGIVGPIGYIDDVVLSAYVLDDILNDIDEEIVTRHWAGEENLLDVIQRILNLAAAILGTGLLKKLKNIIS